MVATSLSCTGRNVTDLYWWQPLVATSVSCTGGDCANDNTALALLGETY